MGWPDFDIPDPLTAPASGTNLLRTGLAWLTGQLNGFASEAVIYVDQEGNRIACRATLGNKLLKIDDMMGGWRIEWTDMDFLIPAASLVDPFGETIVPTRGDQVLLTIGDEEQTFEVAPYGSDPPWRWADPHQSMMRIHTKLLQIDPYQ